MIRDLIKAFYNANYPGETHTGVGFISLIVEGIKCFFAVNLDNDVITVRPAKYRPQGILEGFFEAYYQDRQKKDNPEMYGLMLVNGKRTKPIIYDEEKKQLRLANWC